jgi:hypothetical protein
LILCEAAGENNAESGRRDVKVNEDYKFRSPKTAEPNFGGR